MAPFLVALHCRQENTLANCNKSRTDAQDEYFRTENFDMSREGIAYTDIPAMINRIEYS